MNPIPLHRHTETLRGSNLNADYGGYNLCADRETGRVQISTLDGQVVDSAPTTGDAQRMIDFWNGGNAA